MWGRVQLPAGGGVDAVIVPRKKRVEGRRAGEILSVCNRRVVQGTSGCRSAGQMVLMGGNWDRNKEL